MFVLGLAHTINSIIASVHRGCANKTPSKSRFGVMMDDGEILRLLVLGAQKILRICCTPDVEWRAKSRLKCVLVGGGIGL